MAASVFDPLLELDLKENPGVVKFTTLEELEAFVAEEQSAWAGLIEQAHALEKSGRGPFGMIIGPQRQALSTIETAVKNQRVAAKQNPVVPSPPFAKILASYLNRTCIHAQSTIGREILSRAKNPPDAISLFMSLPNAIEFQAQTPSGSPLLLNPIINGVVLSKLLAEGLVGPPKAATTAEEGAAVASAPGLAPLMDEMRQALKTLGPRAPSGENDAVRQSIAEAERLFAEQRAAHEAEMNIVREAYYADRARLAPGAFWAERAARCRRSMWGWSTAFLLACFAGPFAIYASAVNLIAVVSENAAQPPGTAWLIAIPVIIVFGLLRFLYRGTASSIAASDDAAARVTMIETYIALEAQGKLAPGSQPLLLETLFAPSGLTYRAEPHV